jgi:tRNA G18 (ribose-2'-O)-methylase SpoU
MKSKIRTTPDMSLNSNAHQEAVKLGDDHYRLWTRNVVDKFKSLEDDEIKRQLKENCFPYAVLIENWISDLNIGSCIRNANAFNAREVYYIGDKRFDRRGMCGVHNYTSINWLSSKEELINLKQKYYFVGLDNIQGSKPINNYKWKENTLMIFGAESVGLTPEMISLCDEIIHIKQFGSVRSLNAATASGIVMNDFVTKYSV